VAQPREALADRLEHIDRPVAVLNVGGMDQDEQHEATGVRDDMTLPALDLLARVIPANPAGFRGFDRLTVDHPALGDAVNADRRFLRSADVKFPSPGFR
jgi:hypothetical protein